MVSVPTTLIESILRSDKTEIDEFTRKAVSGLKALKKSSTLTSSQKSYLTRLINGLPDIVTASPSKLLRLKKAWALPKGPIKKSAKGKKSKKIKVLFKDKILKALRYEELREKYYPSYFQRIGIKSCVYCNSQLAVCVESGASVKAKFQVDHFIPQGSFPCFSISLFNLYPTCNSCNNSKRKQTVKFQLYSSSKKRKMTSDFEFSIDPASIVDYFITRNSTDLEIRFKEPRVRGSKNFQEMFDIKGIYDTQKDLAEELIWKAEIYTPDYKKELKKSFKALFSDLNLSNRVIVGNYTNEDELHKRPMSKFSQDIARQLGLLEK